MGICLIPRPFFLFLTGVLSPDDKILFAIAAKSIQKNLEKSSAIWFFLVWLINVIIPAVTICVNIVMKFYKITTSHLAFSLKYFASSRVQTILS